MGLEGASEGFSKVSSVLTTFGTVLMALPPIIKLLGLTFSSTGIQISVAGFTAQLGWWPFILILLAVVAVVGILIAVFVALAKNTPEAKLKEAQEAAEVAAEAADRAADAYRNLSDAFDSLSDKYAALEELTRGSREWRDAVKEINDEVLNLVDQYPELAGLVESKGGVLTLDLESDEA
jgi:uncharacterized membrane protein YcjF (UPF0283 family)